MRLLRRLRGQFGLGESRLAVRRQLAWYWRWAGYGLAGLLAAGAGWGLFDTGRRLAGFDRGETARKLAELSELNQRFKSENETLKAQLTRLERQSQVDQAAQKELSTTLAQLQEEGAQLKEELGFLRNIMSAGSVPEGLSVREFKVEKDAAPNEYHYRLLLTQGGRRDKDFTGRAQLLVSLQPPQGPASVMQIPAESQNPALNINFKYYQRIEGRFRVTPGAVVKSVQLRIFEMPGGQVRLTRSTGLS